MNDLIKDLQDATEGSRELDVRIGMFISPWPCEKFKGYHAFYELKRRGEEDKEGVFPPNYTTNLEDAMKLLPKEWNVTISYFHTYGWATAIGKPGQMETDMQSEFKQHPALSTCIMALKTIYNE